MLGFEQIVAFVLIVVSAFVAVDGSPVYTDDKRSPQFNREFMHFGKRAANYYALEDGDFNRAFMPFGKRDFSGSPWEEQLVADKKNFNREFMHFGKRSPQFSREFMHFGKRR